MPISAAQEEREAVELHTRIRILLEKFSPEEIATTFQYTCLEETQLLDKQIENAKTPNKAESLSNKRKVWGALAIQFRKLAYASHLIVEDGGKSIPDI